MAINKVVYGADTLVDLTEDTVTAEDVLNSKSFHTPDGVKRTGTASYPVTDVQVNGTSVMDGTVAKVEQPTAEVKTATTEFNTANGGLLSKCQINLVPVQSGSGDPYPAGGGKNKLEVTSTTQTINGVTFTVNSDGTVTANGTATANIEYAVYDANVSCPYIGYILSGCPSGGSNTTYEIRVSDVTTTSSADYGTGKTINITETGRWRVRIIIRNGVTVNNLVFEPMIRLATETDPTFAPYSNVRPISGHTEVSLYNVGKNWFDKSIITSITGSGVEYQIQLLPNTEYTMTTNHPLSNSAAFVFFKLSGESSSTFQNGVWNNHYHTLTTGADGIAIVMVRTLDVETLADFLSYNYQIELGNTGTTFEPYNPSSHLYQVQIGSTVYGGYVDAVSGVMVATWAWVDLGTLTWAYNTSRTRFEANLSDIKYNADRYHLMMPNYKFFQGSPNDMPDFNYTCSNNSTGIYVKNSLYGNDTASFIASMTGYIGVYELATPQTIQLTPQQIETLAGQNNLSTPLSGQSIETNGVEYKELFTFADVKEYVKPLIPYSNAGSHNAIYRGKYLGDHVTPEQWASIVAGTFDDLFIGDYWTINSVNWRIAHFDYWLGTGDTACTTHHVVIVPDTILYNAKMNSTDITTGGYYNSKMRGGVNYLVSGSSDLYSASETIKSAFGSSHILTHREILTNAVSSGDASGWSWYHSSVELMSEVMVFGTLAWSVGGKGYEVGIDKEQFALFRHDISKASNYDYWWLRGVISNEGFGFVSFSGIASNSVASSSRGVRPCFAIK